MDKAVYERIESHMLSMMTDNAHDSGHIYRVLFMALEIAAHETSADLNILIPACLLHDIGRDLQYANPELCHAKEGARLAYPWLVGNGWNEKSAAHIRDCITTHRYRSDNEPQSIEAKILFDADKLDAAGTMGIVRSFYYQAHTGIPMYELDEAGDVMLEYIDERSSFFQEYNFKLKNIYKNFYTAKGRKIAAGRQKTAQAFYEAMLSEVRESMLGRSLLEDILAGE